ncbi:pdm3 [Drosophila busckii]|uniref:Pdm3 n=2 Tax=Drosophila busckii TaxID=30019 RepID=A0A0M4E897_DROBS|nr:pdm3 [Drosophila busckii]
MVYKKKRDEPDCPESKTVECRTLKSRICSPTDPPVRPCSEDDCIPESKVSCCVNSRIAKSPCEESRKSSEFVKKEETWVSMWESYTDAQKKAHASKWGYPPECCPTCDDVRFDVLYYRPSNKCRKYQRTWWECCPRMVPKRVCCWCDALPPEPQRRCLPLCPRSACSSEHEKKRMACINKKSNGCMRLLMPCCRAARIPPRCTFTRPRTVCVKPNCPFPSFSECIRDPFPDEPNRECDCLTGKFQCLQFDYLKRMQKNRTKFCPCPDCPEPRSSDY